MSEFKIGSVICLKSDTAMNFKRYFTVSEVYEKSVIAVGFNSIDGKMTSFDILKECVDLIK